MSRYSSRNVWRRNLAAAWRQPYQSMKASTKYSRPRGTRSKGRSVAAQVKKVLNGRTGGFVGLEKKFYDTTYGGTVATSANAAAGEADPGTGALCLNAVSQGDSESQRDGRQIAMNSITIKGSLVMVTGDAILSFGETPNVSVYLVLDKQTNAAQCQSEQVFENPSATAVLNTMPFRNLENSERFRILKSVHIPASDFIGASGGNGTTMDQGGTQVSFSIYKKLNGMKVNYISGATGSLISAIADNSLHVIAYMNNPAFTCNLNYQARLRFHG